MSESSFFRLERPEPIVRAAAMQYIVLERQDPDQMENFIMDFGLRRVAAEGETRYYRGNGCAPYHVAVRPADQNAFVGLGLAATSDRDLERLSLETSVPIETAVGPGAGRKLTLADPDGLKVDFISGVQEAAPIPYQPRTLPLNTPDRKARVNQPIRPDLAPSPIARLGHVFLERTHFLESANWYMRHFGFIASDIQYFPDGRPGLGFFRLDRGDEPTDHHSLAILGAPGPRMGHVSFETFDLDALGQGGQYLQAQGWEHYWGIGRHALGSQVFDYYKDPVGDEWEHYIDGDVMDASYETNYIPLTRGSLWQWGADLPDTMQPPMTPEQAEAVHAAGGFGPAADKDQVVGLMAALAIPPRPWMS